jgi:hypothetical protein
MLQSFTHDPSVTPNMRDDSKHAHAKPWAWHTEDDMMSLDEEKPAARAAGLADVNSARAAIRGGPD